MQGAAGERLVVREDRVVQRHRAAVHEHAAPRTRRRQAREPRAHAVEARVGQPHPAALGDGAPVDDVGVGQHDGTEVVDVQRPAVYRAVVVHHDVIEGHGAAGRANAAAARGGTVRDREPAEVDGLAGDRGDRRSRVLRVEHSEARSGSAQDDVLSSQIDPTRPGSFGEVYGRTRRDRVDRFGHGGVVGGHGDVAGDDDDPGRPRRSAVRDGQVIGDHVRTGPIGCEHADRSADDRAVVERGGPRLCCE